MLKDIQRTITSLHVISTSAFLLAFLHAEYSIYCRIAIIVRLCGSSITQHLLTWQTIGVVDV